MLSNFAQIQSSEPELSSYLLPIAQQAKGIEFQLFNTLRRMKYECAVFEATIPDLNVQIDNSAQRTLFNDSLRDLATWQSLMNSKTPCSLKNFKNAEKIKIRGLWVPGTISDKVIGSFLLRHGLVTPVQGDHWVPNARLFCLTEKGKAVGSLYQVWWSELSVAKKLFHFVFS